MAAPLEANRPVLVGRSSELDAIGEFLAGARAGTASTLLLSGDAGVGKTALVQSARERLEADVLVLQGASLPLATLTVPFLALRTAVREASRRLDAGPLVDLDGIDSDAADIPAAFDAWLDQLCRDRPVVLFIDDLHWADQSTLDVLMYLIAGPADRPLAIIGTIRRGEVGDEHPLARWLADTRRLPRVEWLDLGPLDRIATGQQLAGILGTAPHETLVEDVFTRTGGNAYLNRLLASGLDPSSPHLPALLPSDLRSAVLQSWRRLPAPGRELTRMLAVVGIPAHAADLDAVARNRIGVRETTQLLRESVEAGILDAATDGSYWFHHPLYAEVLEGTLDDDERIALHSAVADYYERFLAEGSAPRVETIVSIADHRNAAHQSADAYRWALRAADVAGASGGSAEELRLLHRAAGLRGELADVDESARSLLERLRVTAANGGQMEEELAAIDSLLEDLDPESEPLLAAELLVRRTHLRFSTGAAFMAADDLRTAVALSARHPESWQHAFALAELAHSLLWQEDPEAPELAARSLRIARQSGDSRAISYAMTAVTIDACSGGGRAAPESAFTAEAVDAALASRDYWAVMHATLWEGNAREIWSSRSNAEHLRGRREQLTSLGAPHAYLAKLASDEASSWQAIGRWRECTSALRIALGSNPGPLADVSARLTAARLATLQGRQAEAEAHLARADELFRGLSDFLNFQFDAVRAEVRLGAGDAEGAFASAIQGATTPGVPPTMCEWLIPLAARAGADLIRAARDSRSGVDEAMARVDDLVERFPGVLRELGDPTALWAAQTAALDLVYAAEVSRARQTDDAAEQWLRAADACDAGMLAWEEAYSLQRAAEAFLLHPVGGAHEHERAASVLRRGISLAEELGAEPVRAHLADLAASARIPIAPVAVDSITAGALPGLTPREAEILDQVVAGRSYGEIARALVISEKTVSSHISNVLRKTGATNRIDLARMARTADAVARLQD